MGDTQWSKADRAAAALQAYVQEASGIQGEGYGDEGSEEFDAAVNGLLVDLKHLLWRVYGPDVELTELVEAAVNVWSDECESLPDGGDDGEP